MYDIIGDIHGHAGELIQLLQRMDYRRLGRGFMHSQRTAIFVGDFIDRGPRIRETLQIVHEMVEQGAALAVMGNHEFNALAFHTPVPGLTSHYFRPHSDRNVRQHQATLDQLPAQELTDFLNWFKTLPVSLELAGLKVVHACWNPSDIEVIQQGFERHGRFTPDFLREATVEKPDGLFQSVEHVLKGPDIHLPDGMTFLDKDNHPRRYARVKWYEDPTGRLLRQYVLESATEFPEVPVPVDSIRVNPWPRTAPPVFFGHYWLRAESPQRLAPNVACVDYSVARKGMLCAYRWNGETQLSNDSFITVKAS